MPSGATTFVVAPGPQEPRRSTTPPVIKNPDRTHKTMMKQKDNSRWSSPSIQAFGYATDTCNTVKPYLKLYILRIYHYLQKGCAKNNWADPQLGSVGNEHSGCALQST